MEEVLPREMICEVIKYLSEQDLTTYGQVSKMTLESSEMEWKIRYERLTFEKKEDTSIMTDIYWMKNYIVNYKNYFSVNFKKMLDSFSFVHTKQEKKIIMSKMFDFILENRNIVFGTKYYAKFREAIYAKLNEFLEGNEIECQIADKYYPLLFPEEYPIAVIQRDEKLKEMERKAYEDAIEDYDMPSDIEYSSSDIEYSSYD